MKVLINTIEKQDAKLAQKRAMIGELNDKLNRIKFQLSVLLHNIEEEEKEESTPNGTHSLMYLLSHLLTHSLTGSGPVPHDYPSDLLSYDNKTFQDMFSKSSILLTSKAEGIHITLVTHSLLLTHSLTHLQS